jgi:predicted nucleic acid-binding protein
MSVVVLDAGPLGLLMQRKGVAVADGCKKWLSGRIAVGVRVVVREIADYEVRRELLRLGKSEAIRRLDAFNFGSADRYVPLTTAAMRVAAQLWARARGQGQPTADPKELDADVILAAQVLSLGLPPADVVVATTDVGHISRFTAADLWSNL